MRSFNPLFSLAATLAIIPQAAIAGVGTIQASATVTSTPVGIGTFQDSFSLQNTGATPISTFWYAWDDSGLNFLPSLPTQINAPANWVGLYTYNYNSTQANYTYGIEWYTYNNHPLAAGQSLAGFNFRSTDPLSTLTSISNVTPINPGDPHFPVSTSFVYQNYPAQQPGDVGFQFVVAPASIPEPASLSLLALGAGALTLRRRARRN